MIRNFPLLAFLAGVILVIYLSLFPAALIPVEVTTWDKANHAAAYAMLAFVGGLSIGTGRPLLLVAVALLILGGGLEIAQAAVPNRTPSPFDVLADAVGIALGISFAIGAWAVRRSISASRLTNS